MKKTIALILMFLLAMSSFGITNAEEITVPADEPVIEEYIDLSRVAVSLRINGNTAQCSGSARSIISTDTIKMTMYLQKQTSTGWSNVASWYKEGTRLVMLDKSKSGLSAGTYRVLLYVTVYDSNGIFVESAFAYSKLKAIP